MELVTPKRAYRRYTGELPCCDGQNERVGLDTFYATFKAFQPGEEFLYATGYDILAQVVGIIESASLGEIAKYTFGSNSERFEITGHAEDVFPIVAATGMPDFEAFNYGVNQDNGKADNGDVCYPDCTILATMQALGRRSRDFNQRFYLLRVGQWGNTTRHDRLGGLFGG